MRVPRQSRNNWCAGIWRSHVRCHCTTYPLRSLLSCTNLWLRSQKKVNVVLTFRRKTPCIRSMYNFCLGQFLFFVLVIFGWSAHSIFGSLDFASVSWPVDVIRWSTWKTKINIMSLLRPNKFWNWLDKIAIGSAGILKTATESQRILSTHL